MPNTAKFDVIIVGAGPAGSLCAYLLSRHGLNVMILEKKTLPRTKPCAGGLTRKALSILPFDITHIVEDYSYTARIFLNNKAVFVKTLNHPVVGMIMRDKFDHFLADKAISAGAVVRDGTSFRSLSGPVGNLNVGTSKGTYKSRLLVGADGVNGKTAKALGLQFSRNVMTAIEGEVYYRDSDTVKDLRKSVHIDFGVIPKGYGWVFPKSDHLSIGLVTTANKMQGLRNYFMSYIRRKNLSGNAEIRSLRGHFIPYRPDKRNLFANKKGVLVGDSAGLADPVTGEGIFYAIREAQIASDVILKALQSDYGYTEEYNDSVKAELVTELTCAQRMANVLYKWPAFGYWVLRTYGHKLGHYYMDVVAGKKTYCELQNEIFRLSTIMSILCKQKRYQALQEP